jgi:hypothetical protein
LGAKLPSLGAPNIRFRDRPMGRAVAESSIIVVGGPLVALVCSKAAVPFSAVPPCVGKVLGLVRTLIAYGQNLAATLRQHRTAPRVLPYFLFVARSFGIADLAPIVVRITRGNSAPPRSKKGSASAPLAAMS